MDAHILEEKQTTNICYVDHEILHSRVLILGNSLLLFGVEFLRGTQ